MIASCPRYITRPAERSGYVYELDLDRVMAHEFCNRPEFAMNRPRPHSVGRLAQVCIYVCHDQENVVDVNVVVVLITAPHDVVIRQFPLNLVRINKNVIYLVVLVRAYTRTHNEIVW